MPASKASDSRATRLRIRDFIMKHRVSLGDLGVIAAIVLVLCYLAFEYDIFVTEGSTPPAGKTIELDEALLVGAVLTVGLLVFSLRRYREQKQETALRLHAEREARELAYQDPLTGLPNRRQFDEALRIAVASPPGAGLVHAVFMLDLNGFKQINDVHGHDVGDAMLLIVAQRLRRAMRGEEVVARLGGDEFVILARHLLGSEAAASVALRVLQELSDSFVFRGVRHNLSAGIGIALLPMDADSPEEAMRKADIALYRAKAERRSAFRFFEADMDRMIRERESLERQLKTAIVDNEIVPRFLPSRDLHSGRVVGFEAVPHWVPPGGEAVPPERFLPIAVESGLIHLLARRILESACRVARDWPEEVTLAVNVLPGQVQDAQLAGTILQTLREARLVPGRLQLDISESIVVQDLQAAKRLITPLQEAGVRIALDHFGTGYSSLYHIREFTFDKVKIDRRLVEGMQDETDAKLVRALVGLGQGLGLAVSASGVDGAASAASLARSGVQEGQSTRETPLTEAATRALLARPCAPLAS